jgi:hypothetical protein
VQDGRPGDPSPSAPPARNSTPGPTSTRSAAVPPTYGASATAAKEGLGERHARPPSDVSPRIGTPTSESTGRTHATPSTSSPSDRVAHSADDLNVRCKPPWRVLHHWRMVTAGVVAAPARRRKLSVQRKPHRPGRDQRTNHGGGPALQAYVRAGEGERRPPVGARAAPRRGSTPAVLVCSCPR